MASPFDYHFSGQEVWNLPGIFNEDNFDTQIHVFQHIIGPHATRYNPVFHASFIIPCEQFHEELSKSLQSARNSRNLFSILSNEDIQLLVSDIIYYAQTYKLMVQLDRPTTLQTNQHRLIRFGVDVIVPTPYQEDLGTITNAVIEQSMQQRSTASRMEKIMASLQKVKVNRGKAETEQCNVCLEKFEDNDDVLAIPCEHVYHKNCIVEWLKISHVCPLCRFQIPMN